MLELIIVALLSGVGLELAWLIYRQGKNHEDALQRVSDAVDGAVSRQDDRIRKKLERAAGTEAGQVEDTSRINHLMLPGVPLR
jgi:hypothetical protein